MGMCSKVKTCARNKNKMSRCGFEKMWTSMKLDVDSPYHPPRIHDIGLFEP
jgi:hypothetical protein